MGVDTSRFTQLRLRYCVDKQNLKLIHNYPTGAFIDQVEDLTPELVDYLQAYANDPAEDETWEEIIEFMEKDLASESHIHKSQ